MLRIDPALQRRPFRQDFKPRNIGRRITVVLPTDQAGDRLSLRHSGTGKDPVIGIGANPITTTVDRFNIAGTD